MPDTDTSAEAVERLAERMEADAHHADAARYQPYTDSKLVQGAATLRALLAERDALAREVERMREALEEIATSPSTLPNDEDAEGWATLASRRREAARAALARGEEG